MKIRKKEPSVGILGKIINSFSSSKQDTYSCDFINQLFPIGKVEIFFDNEDHSNHLGLTWERTSIGKVPVGIDSSDTDFNTIGKTGGEKEHKLTIEEMPTHSHLFKWSKLIEEIPSVSSGEIYFGNNRNWNTNTNSNITDNTGGNQPHNIVQPYEVMAFWKRVK